MRRRSLQFRNILAILAAVAFVATFFGLAYKNTPTTDAAVKATDFKAGRIIDDEIFYDPNTMTVSEIQTHLDKYSANCDMWGEKAIGYGRKINGVAVNPNVTRRDYARMMREAGRADYHDAPYVCISKYYENPTTHKTNYDTNAQPEEGMISAAQIIYNAAHEYNINPQVLLVMLKKESYVWGDTWPLKNEYNTVMGYACPDNAPCDSAYFGFYNQVMKAAWQLNYYKEHIYSYGYYPFMTNNIYYSPNYSCGTKAVYLENIATTSLYIYTPYTPNDAALANYPGEAYCGSYGNRNFFMYFSEWFGSTYSRGWQEMTSPRVMTVKQDTLTINSVDSSLTDHWNFVGQHNYYTSKINIMRNGELHACLRTQNDEKIGSNTCVLLERLDEFSPVLSADSADAYISKNDSCPVAMKTLTKSCDKNAPSNSIVNFNSIITIDGIKYLVNAENPEYGYPINDFLKGSNLTMYERKKIITASTNIDIYNFNEEKTGEHIELGDSVIAAGEININQNYYLLITQKNSTYYLIDKSVAHSDGPAEFQLPRYLVIKKDADVVNLLDGTICENIASAKTAFFLYKIKYDGVVYYQTKESFSSPCYIKAEDTQETSDYFTIFMLPRFLKISKNTSSIDVISNEVCESVNAGDVHYFNSKIDIDGKSYFRTRENSTKGSACAIPADSTEELFTDFMIPRNLKISKNTSSIDVISNEVCESVNAGDVHYFNSKIDIDGKSYFRTRENSTKGSACAIPADSTEEL